MIYDTLSLLYLFTDVLIPASQLRSYLVAFVSLLFCACGAKRALLFCSHGIGFLSFYPGGRRYGGAARRADHEMKDSRYYLTTCILE
jgi:hypothetical protein